MSEHVQKAYVTLQEIISAGASVPELSRARFARIKLELSRQISREIEAGIRAEEEEHATRGIA